MLYKDGLEEQYEPLAYHYERSADDEKAVEYLLKAGEKAKRAYLNEVGTGCFQRALERLDASPLGGTRRDWRLEALRGLGEIYLGIGKLAEAEERFRQAVALGEEMGLPPRERAWLLFWLGEALLYQNRPGELIGRAEEALALLGAADGGAGREGGSVEVALMNHLAGVGHLRSGNREKACEFIRRNTPFLQRLPYSEALRTVYYNVIYTYLEEYNVEEATKWLRDFEQQAQQHHDWRAQGDVLDIRADFWAEERGDLRGAIPLRVGAMDFYRKVGGVKHESACLVSLGEHHLCLGRLEEAEEYTQRGRTAEAAVGRGWVMARSQVTMGTISLCRGRWKLAEEAFRDAAQLGQEYGLQPILSHLLGRASLARGERPEALARFQEAAPAARSHPPYLAEVLSGLEEGYGDDAAFRAFCRCLREEHPEVAHVPLAQWYLEPTEPEGVFRSAYSVLPTYPGPIRNTQHAILDSGWVWHDPFTDCSLTVHDSLDLRAANGRDLWGLNRSAPRLLRLVSGDFAAQVVCGPATEAGEPRLGGEADSGGGRAPGPAIGGILLWRDKENYLRLSRGLKGPHELSFHGWRENTGAIIGRGRLPAERLTLRLERLGSRVRALCSADGQHWFTVGQVEFPTEDPVEVGLYAIGNISRVIYPGAYPEGTGIRFESFELWTGGE